MSGGGVLGASASDAVTDALLEEGERPAGRSEWEDALIKHRIIEAPPPPPPSADDDLLAAADSRAPHAKGEAALAQLSVDELDELEDDPDVDERALQTYRRRRLAELSASGRRAVFGEVREVRGSDFVVEVTQASASHPVVVHLYSPLHRSCRTVSHHLRSLASRFPHTKFVEIVAQEAIPNYPNNRTPTLLVYHTGEMQAQVVGIDSLGGADGCTAERIEWRLKEAAAIEGSGLTVNPFSHASQRMQLRRGPAASGNSRGTGRGQRRDDTDDDDDDNDDT